jgi:hypothetical protein
LHLEDWVGHDGVARVNEARVGLCEVALGHQSPVAGHDLLGGDGPLGNAPPRAPAAFPRPFTAKRRPSSFGGLRGLGNR